MKHNPMEIMTIASNVVTYLDRFESDIGDKLAALLTAAAAYENSIKAQSQVMMLDQMLKGLSR